MGQKNSGTGGAAAGAAIGAVLGGPVGALIGALVGGAATQDKSSSSRSHPDEGKASDDGHWVREHDGTWSARGGCR